MANRVYPDWVQEQKTIGTTVKKVGNNYYLYKHSSKWVPGKKNPVPVDTYIGKITPAGIERSSSRKIDTTDTEVRNLKKITCQFQPCNCNYFLYPLIM